LKATQVLIEGAEKKDCIQSYYFDKLSFLVKIDHAPDCPAAGASGNCICGITEAQKWLSENPREVEEV